MDLFMTSSLLETFQHFSSNQFDHSIPTEVAAIICKNSHDIIDDIKEELSKNLSIYVKGNIVNPNFIDGHGIRVNITTGESVQIDYLPLKQVIKSLEKLSTYNDEISRKVLLNCLEQTKCKWSNIVCIIDYAASQSNLNICKLLYKTLGSLVLIRSNDYGWTALHRACHKNNVIAVKTLFETIDPEEIWDYINIPGSNMKESPLFVASTNGHIDVIRLLLNAACTNDNLDRARDYIMNDKNNQSSSLFNNSCANGHLEVVKLLLETVGSDNILSLIMLHNENAFISAAGNGKSEVVEYLLDKIGNKKMDLIKTENYSDTALDYAAFNGHLNVVRVITKHAGNQVKELNLAKAICRTHMNKNVEIAEYLNDIIKSKS